MKLLYFLQLFNLRPNIVYHCKSLLPKKKEQTFLVNVEEVFLWQCFFCSFFLSKFNSIAITKYAEYFVKHVQHKQKISNQSNQKHILDYVVIISCNYYHVLTHDDFSLNSQECYYFQRQCSFNPDHAFKYVDMHQ